MNTPQSASEWLDLVLDPGWTELFDDVVSPDPLGFPGYREQLERARERTGCTESVVVAAGTLNGAPVVAFSFEFGFLGGSMGVAAGERICRAFERATERRVPVIGMTASGGARMQEGMAALAQMPATIIARRKLADVHQPFICYMRSPTTGGVYASFGSSADVLWAEPGATIGFAGPRVAEALGGEPLPEGSHTAEWAQDRGLLHRVLTAEELRHDLPEVLRLHSTVKRVEPAPEPERETSSPWDLVRAARDPQRPHGWDLVASIEPWSLSDTPALRTAVAGTEEAKFIAIHQTRRPLTPEVYRAARREIARATRLGLPIVTWIDTPGADPTSSSEADGIAREISETFDALLSAPIPTVCCVVGEGGSGGALAFAVVDRVLILEKAFFSVIAPEGAAAILRRDDVAEVAAALRLTAHDLRRLNLADRIVSERTEAKLRLEVRAAIAWALADIEAEGGAPTARRFDRWRALGRTL